MLCPYKFYNQKFFSFLDRRGHRSYNRFRFFVGAIHVFAAIGKLSQNKKHTHRLIEPRGVLKKSFHVIKHFIAKYLHNNSFVKVFAFFD